MLALASNVLDELKTEFRNSNPWATAGIALGIAALVLYLLAQFVWVLTYLSIPAVTCGLIGIVLSSKAYIEARESGSLSRMTSAGLALNGLFLAASFSISGFQTLWRLPLVIPFALLAVWHLQLYHPLRQRLLACIPGSKGYTASSTDNDAGRQAAILSQEDYQRLAVIGLYLGIAALAFIFVPAFFLSQELWVEFWNSVAVISLRISFPCYVVGVWFCGLAFLQLLQKGGVSKTAVAGLVVNVSLAAVFLGAAVTVFIWSVR